MDLKNLYEEIPKPKAGETLSTNAYVPFPWKRRTNAGVAANTASRKQSRSSGANPLASGFSHNAASCAGGESSLSIASGEPVPLVFGAGRGGGNGEISATNP